LIFPSGTTSLEFDARGCALRNSLIPHCVLRQPAVRPPDVFDIFIFVPRKIAPEILNHRVRDGGGR